VGRNIQQAMKEDGGNPYHSIVWEVVTDGAPGGTKNG
jgi:hypothetical protein